MTVVDLAPGVALRATGLLGTFSAAGVLHAADVHVAQRLGALCGEPDERVLLAVALAVRGVRMGSVTLRLREAADTVVVDRSDPEAVVVVDLPWPDADGWLDAVRASVLVRVHDDDGPTATGPVRPLVMWGDDVWLERYWRMEQLVAADLTRRTAAVTGLTGDAVRAQLERLWPLRPGAADPDADQRTAAATVLAHGVGVLGGGPGTGKTTTVARVLCALRELSPQAPRVAVAAPSAKARNRIEESLAASAADPRAPVHRRRARVPRRRPGVHAAQADRRLDHEQPLAPPRRQPAALRRRGARRDVDGLVVDVPARARRPAPARAAAARRRPRPARVGRGGRGAR